MTDTDTTLDGLKPCPLGGTHQEVVATESEDTPEPNVTRDDAVALARVGVGTLIVIGSTGAAYVGYQMVHNNLAAMPAKLSSDIQEAIRAAFPAQGPPVGVRTEGWR